MSKHRPAPGSCTGLVLRAGSAGNYLIKQNREGRRRQGLDCVRMGMRSAAGRHTASGTKLGRCRFRGFRDRQWTPLDPP